MKFPAVRRVVVAVAALAVALSACSTGGSGESDGKVTLTMLTHYGNDPLKSGLQKIVDEWNKKNPDIQVKTQAVKYEDLLQTITVRQTGGKAPDIIQAYSLWGGQLARSRVLADVPADIAKDIESNYSKSAVGSVTVDDKVVGYPTEVQTYALYYNKKLLADAGVTVPPKTWAELEQTAAKATERDSKGNIQVAGFGLMSGWDSAVVHPFLSLLNAAGGSYLSEDGKKAAFDSEAGKAALTLEKKLIDAKSADPAINVLNGFTSGKVAMTINAGWWIGSLKTAMKDEYENVGVVPIPGPTADAKGSLAYGYFAGVNAKSRHQEAAWKFLKWMNAEKGKDGATRMGSFQFSVGTIPGRVSDAKALEGTIDDPNYEPFVEALEYAMPEPNPANGQAMKTSLQKSI
ncbi:MAG TPA: ABC transporter substrate-binding protein, partial [Actinopolymorphaceae bacterium]